MLRRALLLSAIAAAACASFTSEAGPDGGTPDAGTSDATTPDAGSTWEPCSTRSTHDQAHFCDDFDDADAGIAAQWTGMYITNGGSVDSTTEALTPPRAMRSHVPEGNMNMEGALHQLFDQVALTDKTRILVDFELHVVTPLAVLDGGGYSHITVLDFGPPDCATVSGQKQRVLELSFHTSTGFGAALKGLQGCPDAGDDDIVQIYTSRTPKSFMDGFHRVRLEIDRAPCPGPDAGNTPFSTTLTIDEAPLGCAGIGIELFSLGKALNFHLGIFAGQAAEHPEQVSFYDNVQVTIE